MTTVERQAAVIFGQELSGHDQEVLLQVASICKHRRELYRILRSASAQGLGPSESLAYALRLLEVAAESDLDIEESPANSR